ncbi:MULTISPECIES: ATP-binding protein [Streptomyces]|uniref:ATP-binding protein n=1 Tax=Streptomyces TaxID=1883 RepID=UPI000E6A3E4E|nr:MULTISPECIES: ATP-binding protein [Streptomyces]MDX3066757.1 ATP-binding protein [Streptomyces sp. ND04-05B]MDX3519569.1 ATP-binding protein [Streptomyces scabiei]
MVHENAADPDQLAEIYLGEQDGMLVGHLIPSQVTLSELRKRVGEFLKSAGIDSDVAAIAVLAVSELVGNAIRACGEGVPVIADAHVGKEGVVVGITDPEPSRLPSPSAVPLDNAEADCGRGLAMLEVFGGDITVELTPFSKRVLCTIPLP